MHPSKILRVGALCAGMVVVGCGFSPGKPVSGSGGSTGSGVGAGGIGNFGGTTPSGQGGLTGQGGGPQCGAVPKSSSKLPPDILIVQDASGSMNEDNMNMSCGNAGCGATSKWALMIPAINAVVSQTESTVNWGLKLFADSGSCGVNNNAAVPVAPMNSAAIATALMARTSTNGGVSNGSSTPTRAAENAAVKYLTGLTDTNPKYIVLATDGMPNCPASGSQSNDDTTAAVAAVTAAKQAGIPTFVVGISAGGAPEMALNMMAVEGGFPQMGQPTQYYPVSSTAEFTAVLQTLVTVATTCTFSIPPPPTNDGTTSREDISVTGDNGTIPQNATDGWTYSDNSHTSITLNGASCDAVMAGTITTVTIIFNCHLT